MKIRALLREGGNLVAINPLSNVGTPRKTSWSLLLSSEPASGLDATHVPCFNPCYLLSFSVMAPKLFAFINKLFRSSWKRQMEYNQSTRKRSNCVLKSVSSKSSLSVGSSCSLAPQHACSMDSINFEFRKAAQEKEDLCCVRKCCEKCFCEEGEALANNLRRKSRRKRRGKFERRNKDQCRCKASRPATPDSEDSACDVTSTSSCDDVNCQFRDRLGGMPVQAFAHIHATACENYTDYETLSPKYENVNSEIMSATMTTNATMGDDDSPYDFVPSRPPRSISEPRYENVLTVNCIDACVFRQISSLVDSTKTPAEVMESLQELHKSYSCVRRSSSADNEINYYYENYDELENDLNLELERRLSD